VADYVANIIIDDAVSDGHGLFGVAGIIINNAFKRLTVDAAGLIDLADRHHRAYLLHVTILGNGAGNRACNTDFQRFSLCAGDCGQQ